MRCELPGHSRPQVLLRPLHISGCWGSGGVSESSPWPGHSQTAETHPGLLSELGLIKTLSWAFPDVLRPEWTLPWTFLEQQLCSLFVLHPVLCQQGHRPSPVD